MQESSRWQKGQKAKEILMGDELSLIILLYHVAFRQKFYLRRIVMIADDSYSGKYRVDL